MFACIIFDLGDTLVGVTKGIEKIYKLDLQLNDFNKAGFNISRKDYFWALDKTNEDFAKLKTQEGYEEGFFVSSILKHLNRKHSKNFAIKLSKKFFSYQKKYTKLEPFAKQTLIFLKRKGLKIGLISNGNTKKARQWLKFFKIHGFFDVVLTSHETGANKSDLKPFKLFLQKINAKSKTKILPENCLMVGDNAFEDISAKKLGMKVAVYLPNLSQKEKQQIKPDFQIKKLNEIKKIIF
jgi:putative hydrolase of the HAD superfamily